MITSAADTPFSCMPTGIPRPLSSIDTVVSSRISTITWSQYPANASSMELSTTSNTRWCSPVPSSVFPMYIPGRLRTASSPSKIWMFRSSYVSSPAPPLLACAAASFAATPSPCTAA